MSVTTVLGRIVASVAPPPYSVHSSLPATPMRRNSPPSPPTRTAVEPPAGGVYTASDWSLRAREVLQVVVELRPSPGVGAGGERGVAVAVGGEPDAAEVVQD